MKFLEFTRVNQTMGKKLDSKLIIDVTDFNKDKTNKIPFDLILNK